MIIRIQKKDNPYVMLDKGFLNDHRLTWKARGMLAYLLSKPDNWRVLVKDLIKRAPDGRDAVYTILKELQRYGYIHRQQTRAQGSTQFGSYDYNVSETSTIPDDHNHNPTENTAPQSIEIETQSPVTDIPEAVIAPLPALPDTALPLTVEPLTAKPEALINNEINNKRNKAAANTLTKPEGVALLPITAAAKDLIEDNTIAEALTAGQQQRLNKLVATCLPFFPGYTADRLTQEIEMTLLNPQCFTQAGRDFTHKLNTIKKQIRDHQWTTPVMLTKTANDEDSSAPTKALNSAIQEAKAAILHWSNMLAIRQDDTGFIQAHTAAQKKYQSLVSELTTKQSKPIEERIPC